MADRGEPRPQPHQIQVHPQQQQQHGRSQLLPQKGPSASQVVAIITILPVGGALLALSGITLVGTFIGLALATPLFVIFSPILVPAVFLAGGATTALMASGAFGLTGLSSLSWVLDSFRRATGGEPLEYAKRQMQEAAIQVGEKTKQMGEAIKEGSVGGT